MGLVGSSVTEGNSDLRAPAQRAAVRCAELRVVADCLGARRTGIREPNGDLECMAGRGRERWLVMSETGLERVWVQVIDVDVAADREITFGRNLAEALGDRLDDIRGAIEAGSASVAKSLKSLASPEGWRLGEVS